MVDGFSEWMPKVGPDSKTELTVADLTRKEVASKQILSEFQ